MKKALYLLAIVISIFIINGLVRSIYDLWKKQDLITVGQMDLEMERRQNLELRKKLSQAKNPQFIEEEARNKLLLVKPGEENVLIPHDLSSTQSSSKKTDARPNWRKWWDLFF